MGEAVAADSGAPATGEDESGRETAPRGIPAAGARMAATGRCPLLAFLLWGSLPRFRLDLPGM